MPVAHEIIQEFLVETYDGLGRLDVELVELEKGQAKADTLGSVFRTIHSLKGSAGFLGFGKLEALTHVAESLLSKLRDGKLVVSVAIVSALLATVDAVREMLRTIEASGQDGSQEYPVLVARLNALTVPEPAKNGAATSTGNSTASSTALVDLAAILNQPAAVMPKPPVEKPAVQQPVAFEDQTQTISVALAKLASQPAAKVPVGKPGRVQSWVAMEVSGKALAAGPDALPAASAVPLKITPAGYPLQPQFEPGQKPLSDSRTGSDSNVRSSDSSHEATAAHVVSPRASDSTIRLSIERVDKMMNLVTELVLSRNQIMQHPLIQANSVLALASRNLNLITSELQESVMRMRMQPINNVWGTLPRVVRDLSLGCGKQVRLVLEGAETELDKSVLDAIKDPLMHLVRNAIDHGFETPDVRQSSGKPVEGCLRLRAYHESGHVHIEITDDGAGIDPAKIKAKARERNLLSVEQAEQLSDESVLSLIFLPGFSTKEAVSNLSGRGVGMDVVKSYVERIGGQVEVHSIVGVGSSFELRIPLTLAIIHALMVSSGGERYAVPQTSMIELIRLDGEKMKSGIEHIHGVRVHRYRGKLLPLVSLTQMLEGSEVEGLESVNIIVLQAHQQQFGLIVDRVHDTQEIVVKPLHKLLRGIACLAGATILGDGEVALILDVVGLAERALGEARTHSVGLTEGTPEPAARAGSLAVRATQEYAYVARDIRRIATVGGSLIAILIALWVVIQATGVGPF